MEQKSVYYADPDLTVCETTVLRSRTEGTERAIALVDNIVRPAGGGEPCDRGIVRFAGKELAIASAVKNDGLTWLRMSSASFLPSVGDKVRVELDAFHRERRRRLHTGLHLVIRSILAFAEVEVSAADISEDAVFAKITANARGVIDNRVLEMIACRANEIVADALPVEAVRTKSVDDARRLFGPQFRISERYTLTGKVRLIKIGDFDVNPCAGLHWKDTAIDLCDLQLAATKDGLQAILHIRGTV